MDTSQLIIPGALKPNDVYDYVKASLGHPYIEVEVHTDQLKLFLAHGLELYSRYIPKIRYFALPAYAGQTSYEVPRDNLGLGVVQVLIPRLDPIAPLLMGSGPRLDIFGYRYCLASDCSVSLLDGRELTIPQIIAEYGMGEFWVYSCDKDGKVVPGRAHSAHVVGENEPVVKVTLDNGEQVKCTASHKFLLKDGTYKEAGKLVAGDSLMPLYRSVSTEKRTAGYEIVHAGNPADAEFTHRIVANSFKTGTCEMCGSKLPDKLHTVRHHRNFNQRDNSPTNLQWVTGKEHRDIHSEPARRRLLKKWQDPEFRSAVSAGVRRSISSINKENWTKPEYRAKLIEALKARHANDPEFQEKLAKSRAATLNQLWKDDAFRLRRSVASSKRLSEQWQDPAFQSLVAEASSISMTKKWKDPEFRSVRSEAASAQVQEQWQDPVFVARMKPVQAENGRKSITAYNVANRNRSNHSRWKHEGTVDECAKCNQTNHKVVSVEPCGTDTVYDIAVDTHHNFALSSGIYVSNSYPYRDISELYIDYIYFAEASRILSSTFEWDFTDGAIKIAPKPDDSFTLTYASAFPHDISTLPVADRDWIKDYVLARAKTAVGMVRSKFQIPGSQTGQALDGQSLVQQGLQETQKLERTIIDRTPPFPLFRDFTA